MPEVPHSNPSSSEDSTRPAEDSNIVEHLFYALPFPLLLVDAVGALIKCNTEAERLFGLELSDHQHGTVLSLLTVARTTENGLSPWTNWEAFHRDLLTGNRIPCHLRSRDGHIVVGEVVGTPLVHRGVSYTLLALVEDRTADVLVDTPPAWALTDPMTGLPNRVFWDQQRATCNAASGTLLFMDLDDLKTVNDLYGHDAGDHLLALVGQAVQSLPFPEGVLVRYGGDEFVGWCRGSRGLEAQAYALAINERLQALAATEDFPLVPHVSYGSAQYAPGHLEEALHAADQAMYAQKGTLLASQRGGHLIISRNRRTELQSGGTSTPNPGQFASQFGLEFDAALRSIYARHSEEAQSFIRFAAPEPGTAVVEVGAGTGRLAFDGGLADSVGAEGILLLTDPSQVQLQQARQRAQATPWVRFLVAPAESLPLASGGADYILGSWFLHLCDPATVIHELTRVLRSGGQLALDFLVDASWSSAWMDIFLPLRQALTDAGRPFLVSGHRSGEIVELCQDLGLTVERTLHQAIALTFSDWRIAWQFLNQGGHLGVMAEGLSPTVRTTVFQAVESRMAAVFAQASPKDLVASGGIDYLVARKP